MLKIEINNDIEHLVIGGTVQDICAEIAMAVISIYEHLPDDELRALFRRFCSDNFAENSPIWALADPQAEPAVTMEFAPHIEKLFREKMKEKHHDD